MLDRLWPSIVTGGWDNSDLKAAKYMMVGTNNRAIVKGLTAAIRFGNDLGREVPTIGSVNSGVCLPKK
jgi:isopenicillin-N epimerase